MTVALIREMISVVLQHLITAGESNVVMAALVWHHLANEYEQSPA